MIKILKQKIVSMQQLWIGIQKAQKMIEPLLCGIVLGLVPITLLGLFVSAWNQYRRGSGMLDID